MEFNYKRNLIKDILKKIETFHPKCKSINLKEIRSFVSNKKEPAPQIPKDTAIFYKERSKGEFKNETKDRELHKVFEAIREEIIKNNA